MKGHICARYGNVFVEYTASVFYKRINIGWTGLYLWFLLVY